MKNIFIALLVGFVTYTLFFRGDKPIEDLTPLPKKTVILSFGDSLTNGYGASKGKSYPEQLAKLLNVKVIKEGINGEVSADGLKRLPSILSKYNPNILILCHGGNDILRKKNLKITKQNIKKMITLAQNHGIKVILVGVPSWEGIFIKTASFYEEIANEMQIVYEDESMETIINDATLKFDNIHPNDKGYKLMAEKIRNLILKR